MARSHYNVYAIHVNRLPRIARAALPFFMMAGCSSDSGSGGPQSSQTSTCGAVDVCSKIALDHVNTLCGTTAARTTPTDNASTDPSQLPDVHGCDYQGSPADQTTGGQTTAHQCTQTLATETLNL
jgi:hypothetical protein